MARTIIQYTGIARVDGSIPAPAAVPVSSGAGNGIAIDGRTAFPENTLLVIENTGGAGTVVHVKAGAQPLAPSSGQGDLDVAVGAGATVYAGPFESARFEQPDGSLALDADAAVSVVALLVKRH